MKETFRKNVENFSALAKDEIENEKRDLQEIIDWHITKAARARGTSKETQVRVHKLQLYKQELMLRLKDEIKSMDDPAHKAERYEGQLEVTASSDGKFNVTSDKGEKFGISLGEIMTDGEWGTEYYLDPNTVPRNIRKRYLIGESKRILGRYLDRQISIDAIGSSSVGKFRRRAYTAVLEQLENGTKHTQGGFIAESMVRNFIKKLKLDNDLDIEIIDVDAEQDVESKMDFIIRRSKHTRGVNVDTKDSASYEDIGIQFTTNFSAVEQKQRRIDQIKTDVLKQEKISDLVLVAMPLSAVINDYDKWKGGGKKPGGPDKNMPVLAKQKIFESILAGIFTPEELKERWTKMGIEWKDQNWVNELENLENGISRSGVARLKKDLSGENPNIKVESLLKSVYQKVTQHYMDSYSTKIYPTEYEQWREMVLKNLK